MQKKIFLYAFPIFFALWLLAGFLWWNEYPPLPAFSKPEVIQLYATYPIVPHAKMKALSYNIHFGIGLEVLKNSRLDKRGFEMRLDAMAKILRAHHPDIVFLQEVDFDCARSHHIDEATYLAKKAGYPFLVKSSFIKGKFHPSYHGFHGKIDHGLAILSKYPLKDASCHIFSYPEEVPFYLRWLYSPHGIQMAKIKLPSRELCLINVHLEPWVQEKREQESSWLKSVIESLPNAVLVGGDFNALPPEAKDKSGHYLSDTPWFIRKDTWDLLHEKTIATLRKIPKISFDFPLDTYVNNEHATFTFPANKPIEKLDYFFAKGNAHIEKSYIVEDFDEKTSDHLPLATIFTLKEASSKNFAKLEAKKKKRLF